MIDLHMHTNLSDGFLSVYELLNILKNKNITHFAITDHNHALAYEQIDDVDFAKCFVGAEIATSMNGHIVEVLLYKGDATVINDWYRKYYSFKNLSYIENTLFEDLKNISLEQNYKLPLGMKLEKIEKGYAKKQLFNALKENNPDFPYDRYKTFFRHELSNPDSLFFLDEARTYPSIRDVIDLAEQSGSYTILAHPFEYGLDIREIQDWVLKVGLDGIESFHPSSSNYNSIGILNFCEQHNLISSMGSDYHRDSRMVPLGVHVHPQVLKSPCFNWIFED